MVTGFSQIRPAQTILTPSVTIGGKPLTGVVAEVIPGMIGSYRVTAKVPAGIGVGDQPVILEIVVTEVTKQESQPASGSN